MTQLDHVMLFCAAGAPEAEALRSHGFLEGSGQSHPGQGTRNRRFSFANAYLELVWVDDEALARSDLVRPTQLWERWHRRGADVCPFGLVFRPGSGPTAPPFPAWSYHPPYLPPDLSIDVAVADQVEAAAAQVEEHFGPIDIWINDAMTTVFSPFHEMTAEEFERVTAVTYLGENVSTPKAAAAAADVYCHLIEEARRRRLRTTPSLWARCCAST